MLQVRPGRLQELDLLRPAFSFARVDGAFEGLVDAQRQERSPAAKPVTIIS